MQSRCPFSDCLHIFECRDEDDFKTSSCPGCSRKLTVRSLARYLEIEKQSAKHACNNRLSSQFFQKNESPGKIVAVLEEIRSLWNVGSMFRSADGAGVSHLFLIGITGCPPRKEIAKTSLGAEDHVEWTYAASSIDVIAELKKRGYQIIALEKSEKSVSMSSALQSKLLKTPLCLILGSEVKGVYAETLECADLILDLPMRGFKESLNVAVAFGIASYAIAEELG